MKDKKKFNVYVICIQVLLSFFISYSAFYEVEDFLCFIIILYIKL